MFAIASGRTALVTALVAAGLLAAALPAGAAPLGTARSIASAESHVVRIGSRDRDWEDRSYRSYKHRRYAKRGHYVRAPFTRVKTRGSRWTSVDAPFASVRVRPWGTWVRAPFVDLYVPR
jgi:hypothetical protein